MSGLLPLQVQGQAICSRDGARTELTVIDGLCEGVAVASSIPHPLSSTFKGDETPHWASEAAKGIFLDVSSKVNSSYSVVDIGEVCGTAFLAAARIKLCWMAPTHSSSIADMPRHTQFLLVQLGEGGGYAIILPLLPNNCKATLQPARQQPPSGNKLAVHLDTGNPDFQRSSWQAAVYVAAGRDPFELCDVAVATAGCLTGAKPRWEKQLPDVARRLGWCTWDAFYTDVSAQGIIGGLESFKQAGLQPRWIIIDDGWQRTALDSMAQSIAHQLRQQQDAGYPGSSAASSQPLVAVCQTLRLLLNRLLRTTFGWLHWRCCWPLLLAALKSPLLFSTASWLLQAYNRATSEHSKRLLSTHQFNAKFSALYTKKADTSSAATSTQVSEFVRLIKEQYGLQHVYAWHATMGYWSGVSPAAAIADAATAATAADDAGLHGGDNTTAAASTSEAAAAAGEVAAADVVWPRVGPVMSDLEPPTNWSQLVLGGIGVPQDPRKFFSHLHSQLASLGITGVKVDVQNQLELVGSAAGQQGGQVLAQAWHSALEDSVAAHFQGNLINCMCHNTSDLYRMRDSSLARVSDDFYPALPASHTTHVAVCAFNSLFFGPLVQPDWDMFHSMHPRALLHATARMISGGPVYVSDKPGRHDPTLLARLALPGGRLLQPLLPGRPCSDTLFMDVCGDGVTALKVWNMNVCGGVLALFNVQGSNWSRSRFNFVTHTRKPPAVTAAATPADVWALSSCMQDAGASSRHSQQPAAAAAEGSILAAGIQLGGGLTATGEYVLYRDSNTDLTLVKSAEQGVTWQLASAQSDVVTVAPVLLVSPTASSSSSSSSSSSKVACAVAGLINMLNPGGALKSIQAGGQQQQQRARSSDGSNNGSSGNDSGSWVIAGAPAATVAAPVADTAASVSGGGAAAAGAAGGSGPELMVRFTGCGLLLLYSSVQPQRVLLDGEVEGFSFDASSSRLEVVVPITGTGRDLEHVLLVCWQ